MRDANVTGNENALLPAFASPFPSITDPAQSTSTCRENVAMSPSSIEISPLLARKPQLHRDTDEPEHEPRQRRPSLSRQGLRIENPDLSRRRQTGDASRRQRVHKPDDHRPRSPERGADD